MWYAKVAGGKGITDAFKEKRYAECIILARSLIRTCILALQNSKASPDATKEFQELHDLMEGEDEIINRKEWEEFGFECARDLVEARLDELYDIADGYRVWISPDC